MVAARRLTEAKYGLLRLDSRFREVECAKVDCTNLPNPSKRLTEYFMPPHTIPPSSLSLSLSRSLKKLFVKRSLSFYLTAARASSLVPIPRPTFLPEQHEEQHAFVF